MVSPTWLIQQVIPPALLTYFGWALYTSCTEIGPQYLGRHLGHPLFGLTYTVAAAILIPSISILFLRLYFLSSSQSVPPRDPPAEISARTTIFECLSPAEARAVRLAENPALEGLEDEPLVNRCWKGKCGGRWKPARARHCRECGVCRAGFDHHCAFFANCLSAPYMPTFLALLTLTPPTIVLLSSPLYYPLAARAAQAYRFSWSNETVRGWYDWPWSWVIAGGPVGRYAAGIILAWKQLDRMHGGGPHGTYRLAVGVLVGMGVVLGMITVGLGLATVSLIRDGHLTVDRERARSLARSKAAIASLEAKGKNIPREVVENMQRWVERHYFWVPDPSVMGGSDGHGGGGGIVELKEGIRPYDRGKKGNWELVMGKGWGWILPWQALRRGVSQAEVMNWPLADGVEEMLKREAQIASVSQEGAS